jgi:hypothetical protein
MAALQWPVIAMLEQHVEILAINLLLRRLMAQTPKCLHYHIGPGHWKGSERIGKHVQPVYVIHYSKLTDSIHCTEAYARVMRIWCRRGSSTLTIRSEHDQDRVKPQSVTDSQRTVVAKQPRSVDIAYIDYCHSCYEYLDVGGYLVKTKERSADACSGFTTSEEGS